MKSGLTMRRGASAALISASAAGVALPPTSRPAIAQHSALALRRAVARRQSRAATTGGRDAYGRACARAAIAESCPLTDDYV